MAKGASQRDQQLRVEAMDLLMHLGYSVAEAEDGPLHEVFAKLSNADQAGYSRGHREGHKGGWADHGHEKGCNCS